MKLTQRNTATGVTLNGTFIHIVNTGDTSQDPTGSSYKAPLSLLSPLFTGGTGGVGGSGLNNYVTRWTPDGTTLGNSVIQDNGTSLGIGIIPNNITILDIDTTLQGPFITSTKINTAGGQSAYGTLATSSGINSLGDNIGVAGFANGNSNRAIGVVGNAVNSVGNINIGGYFTAANGVSNYAVQLKDNTETISGGKFLRDMGDGKANWSNITKDDITDGISATGGTNGYVARWTPDGTTLGNSQIFDDGENISVDGAIIGSTKFLVRSDKAFGLSVIQSVNGIAGQYYSAVAGAGTNTGIQANAGGSTTLNVGVQSVVTGTGTDKSIGFTSSVGGGSTNYSCKLQDGTETIGGGKFLRDMGNGEANWADITSADTTGASGSFTSADGKTITVTNGLITSIV